MNRSKLEIFRDRHWATISAQILQTHSIDRSNFDDKSLLRKNTPNGVWLMSRLVPLTSLLILSSSLTNNLSSGISLMNTALQRERIQLLKYTARFLLQSTNGKSS